MADTLKKIEAAYGHLAAFYDLEKTVERDVPASIEQHMLALAPGDVAQFEVTIRESESDRSAVFWPGAIAGFVVGPPAPQVDTGGPCPTPRWTEAWRRQMCCGLST